MFIKQNTAIYVCIGGQGTGSYNNSPIADIRSAGYNGGGYAQCGGGGATHIATTNRGILSNYISYQTEIIIVAGGGGGSDCSDAGSGGGIVGGDASDSATTGGNGGTQYAGGNGIGVGSFGQGGCMGTTNNDSAGGGGGGWYGGGSSKNPTNYSGGGGSGHISSFLINGTTGMQNGVQSGDGYVKITQISF